VGVTRCPNVLTPEQCASLTVQSGAGITYKFQPCHGPRISADAQTLMHMLSSLPKGDSDAFRKSAKEWFDGKNLSVAAEAAAAAAAAAGGGGAAGVR